MNGIIENEMAPPRTQMTPGAAPPAPPQGVMAQPENPPAVAGNPTGGEINQEELDMFVVMGMKLIHNPKVSDTLISSIADAKNPITPLADATLNVVGRIEQSAQTSGKKLSLTTLAYGANVLMGEIISSAEAAGMKHLDEKTKYQAYSLAVSKYIDDALKTGKMTKEEVMQLGKDAEASPMGQQIVAMASKATPGAAPNAPLAAAPVTSPAGGMPPGSVGRV